MFQNPEKGFVVKTDTLVFSVLVYTCCAILAVSFLMVRRFLPVFGNAELGGPKVSKWISSFVFVLLWFLYIILSVLQSYHIIELPF